MPNLLDKPQRTGAAKIDGCLIPRPQAAGILLESDVLETPLAEWRLRQNRRRHTSPKLEMSGKDPRFSRWHVLC